MATQKLKTYRAKRDFKKTAEPDAAGGRHTVRQRLDVVGIALLRLDVARVAFATLERKPLSLLLGVVDLRERVAELDAAGEVLEAFDE